MKNTLWSVVFVLCLVLFGCSAVKVEQKYMKSTDFSILKNYSWLDDESAGQIQTRNPKIEKLVMASVNQQLKRKGYNRTTEENADFHIAWFGRVDEKVAQKSIAHFYRTSGYGVLAGGNPEVVEKAAEKSPYMEGTLILDVIDARSKNVIWRGSATDTIKDGMSDADIAAYIQRSVRKVLSDFPAR